MPLSLCTVRDVVSQSLPAPGALAILPMLLLCVDWLVGEVGLLVAAFVVPLIVFMAGGLVGPVQSPSRGRGDAQRFSRGELVSWLDGALASESEAGQFAAMTLIVDDLDALEDRFGRDTRHAVNLETLRRLKDTLRVEDPVASLDDGVFAFALRNVKAPETENLLRLSRRLQAICDEPSSDNLSRVYCTVSLGLAAEIHVAERSSVALIDAAERAGDFAASSGPGSVRVFSEGLNSQKEDERHRTKALSNALETGEIFAWFQPQMSTDGTRIVGFEALARWDRPDTGLVLPAAFLPEIQSAGLSQRLAEVILKQALTALNAWDAAGFEVPSISVNFSGEDLRNPRLADYVMWELDRYELSPDRLAIEVLESVIAEHHEDAITQTLRSLSAAGCRIDLDDFGTGFTSILNIRRFNVSRLKIDECLVARLDQDEDQQTLVAALLSFSAKLGIDALAEGVETQSERKVLQTLGCPHIQGFVTARPMPLGDTLLWLEEFQETGRLPKVDAAVGSA